MCRLWREYVRFPKYSVGEVLAQTAGFQLPIIIIAALASGPEAGYLTLAARVMQAPASLVGAAVAQVFASEAPTALRANSLGVLTTRTLGGFLKSVVGPMIFFGILAPQIFPLVFGPKWLRAGELVQFMAPAMIVQMMASAIGTVLYVTNNQRLALLLQISGAIIRIGTVLIAAQFALGRISEVYIISGFFFYLIYLITAIRCASISASSLLTEVRAATFYLLFWSAGGIALMLGLSRY